MLSQLGRPHQALAELPLHEEDGLHRADNDTITAESGNDTIDGGSRSDSCLSVQPTWTVPNGHLVH